MAGLMEYFAPKKTRTDVYLMFKHMNRSKTGSLSLEEFYKIYDTSKLSWKVSDSGCQWQHPTKQKPLARWFFVMCKIMIPVCGIFQVKRNKDELWSSNFVPPLNVMLRGQRLLPELFYLFGSEWDFVFARAKTRNFFGQRIVAVLPLVIASQVCCLSSSSLQVFTSYCRGNGSSISFVSNFLAWAEDL